LRKLLENNLSMGDNISSAIIHEKNYRLVLSLLQNNLLDKKFFPRIDTKEFFKFISELPDLSKRGHYLCSALDSQHPIGQVFQNAAEISIIRMMCPPILTPIYIDRNNAVLFKNHWLVKEEVEMVQQENRKTL